ncbi:sel1 repeat family protein [bacterium]|nr:sel1 repeat family protein [bacterium]
MTKHLTKPIRAIHFMVLAFLMTLSSSVAAQDFQKGHVAYEAGDYATAIKEWMPLAEAGDALAQYSLGFMYQIGEGVLQDYKEAVKWWRLAAEQGVAYAQYNLGRNHYSGQGVFQDYKKAVKWWRLAAEQGVAYAQTNLGVMSQNGYGVLQDNATAHMWFNIGSANGNELGGTKRDSISKQMTNADISKAQAMARECMSSGYTKCGY